MNDARDVSRPIRRGTAVSSVLAVALVAACADSLPTEPPSNTYDSGAEDSSASHDTGTPDGSVADSSSAEASTPDATPVDGGTPDGSDASADSSGTDEGAASDGSAAMLAATPPMGWNSWNKFQGNVTEALIKSIADAMVSTGMKAAGYEYVNIDDGWVDTRDASGHIVVNATKFPGGMAALAGYVHGKGLKLGIYTCAGTQTCQGLAGSYMYETQDAQSYASWGIDYVKEDWCNTAGEDPQTQYTVMHDAIVASGRQMVFSLCDWGVNSPWDFGPAIANLWRATGDIADNWPSMLHNLDMTSEHASAAGPGHWNDPDMLEVGNGGMTSDEYRSHFSLWSLLAAPLIAGNDLTSMSADTLATLTNAEVIAVDQDPAGAQGQLVADDGNGGQVWSKRLHTGGSRAVVLFNRGGTSATITARWSDLGLAAGSASVRDLWQHQDLGSFPDSYSTQVATHASVTLVVTGAEGTAPQAPTVYAASSASNTLTGTAVLASCTACAGGQKVGWIGTTPAAAGGTQSGTLQFNGVQAATAGMKTIVIEYLSGESRSASVSVNGAAPVTVQFGDSGPDGDYSVVGTHVLQVPLVAGNNTLLFSNGSAAAPDLSAIDVYP
jgi:hypothetical protein